MASKSKGVRIIRALAAGKTATIFNDRTKVGRSVKVWGWKQPDYDRAIRVLNAADVPCKLVTTPELGSWGRGGSLRIHTQEA